MHQGLRRKQTGQGEEKQGNQIFERHGAEGPEPREGDFCGCFHSYLHLVFFCAPHMWVRLLFALAPAHTAFPCLRGSLGERRTRDSASQDVFNRALLNSSRTTGFVMWHEMAT